MPRNGLIALPLQAWLAIGGAVLLLGALGYARVQTVRLEAAQERLEAIRIAGEEAERAAKAQAKRDIQRKEQADDETNRRIAVLRSNIDRLLTSANQSSLPAASAVTGSPDRIAFDRGELDGAIRAFTGRTAALIGEGAEGIANLDSAKAWAANREP